MKMMHFDPSQGWWPVTKFFPCSCGLQAGNAMNHPERIQADPHTNGGLAFETVWNIPWFLMCWYLRLVNIIPHLQKDINLFLLCRFTSGLSTEPAEQISRRLSVSADERRLSFATCLVREWCGLPARWNSYESSRECLEPSRCLDTKIQVFDRWDRMGMWEIVCGSAPVSNSLFQPSRMFESQYMTV